MMCKFPVDPITKTRIFILLKTKDVFYFARSNLSSPTYWNYYKGDFNWTNHSVEAKMYHTKEEAESDYKKYLNFLKEYGYDV